MEVAAAVVVVVVAAAAAAAAAAAVVIVVVKHRSPTIVQMSVPVPDVVEVRERLPGDLSRREQVEKPRVDNRNLLD